MSDREASNEPPGDDRRLVDRSHQPCPDSRPTLPQETAAVSPANLANEPSTTEHPHLEKPRQPQPQPQPTSSGAYFLLATSMLLFVGWFIGPQIVEQYQYASTKGRLRAEYENADELLEGQPLRQVSLAYQLVAHKVRPSVVSIQARKTTEPGSFLEGFGSGVIMSEEGYIITNAHVLDGATECWVELHDRRRYAASVIGADEFSDLAVLKIDATDLIPADWGPSEDVSVGSIVWAVGSPYRYQQTVTSGILSGKDRPGDEARKQNLLQTDAAVNPGNSGGPLVDANGRVIGINTSIFGDKFQGISFAVPSETALFVYQQLCKSGTVTRGYLGVTPIEVRHDHAIRLSLQDLNGALLRRVENDTPASRAGLRVNDVIRTWDGQPITNYNNLYQLAEMSPPNSLVDVTLIRDGELLPAQVTIGELPKRQSMSHPFERRRTR